MTDGRSPLDLDRDTMRRLGYQVTDVVAEHLATLRNQPAQRSLGRQDAELLLAGPPPEHGIGFEQILATLRDRVFPYHAREPHPRFMGYVPSCPTFPAVLGDWLATGHNFFAGVWSVAAGPNEVELVVLEWFRQWLGMPEGTRGLLTSGGSAATLTAVVAARHERAGDDAELLPRLTVYITDQSHSSVARAAWIAGVLRSHVRCIATDARYRMRVDALRESIEADRSAGLTPCLVGASAGTTNTGAVDPLADIADVCASEGIWMHVDAAYAGFAALTEPGRATLSGIERADSITLDPHKWLFVPFECGCLLAKTPELLEAAYRANPEYLKDVEPGHEEVNFADFGEQLTRHARALKIWVSLQYFGLAAIREAIARGIALAKYAERRVGERGGLEVLSPAQFGVLCFRVRPDGVTDRHELNALNERVNTVVNGSGRFLMSSTRLRGTYSLRICTHGFRTEEGDVDALIEAIAEAATGASR